MLGVIFADQPSVPIHGWVVGLARALVVADHKCAGWLVDCDERGEANVWAYFVHAGFACEFGYDGVLV